jgi:hypothetical protein
VCEDLFYGFIHFIKLLIHKSQISKNISFDLFLPHKFFRSINLYLVKHNNSHFFGIYNQICLIDFVFQSEAITRRAVNDKFDIFRMSDLTDDF